MGWRLSGCSISDGHQASCGCYSCRQQESSRNGRDLGTSCDGDDMQPQRRWDRAVGTNGMAEERKDSRPWSERPHHGKKHLVLTTCDQQGAQLLSGTQPFCVKSQQLISR